MTTVPKISYTYAISLVVSPSDDPELLAKSLKSQYKEAKKELSLRKSQDMELFTVNEIMDLDIK